MRLAAAGPVVQVAFALGFALVAAPVVRTVTAELGNTVGRAWPFSAMRCASRATPGCGDAATPPLGRRSAGPAIRMGRL